MALGDAVSEPYQRAALERWIALASQGDVGRRDLAPEMFGRALQYVDLIEVLEEEDDYRHVIEGREVIRRFGSSGRERFTRLYEPVYLGRLRAFYETVKATGTPNFRPFAALSLSDEELSFSQLALPAIGPDGCVSHIAVVFAFPDPLQRIPTTPLRIHSAWRRLERGTDRETMLGDRHWR